MTPESPLQQCKRHFENFKAQTPHTVQGDQVHINQEVQFTPNCREEALETLTIQNIIQEINGDDGFYYFMLQATIDGPVTDGNRIQKVNDCEIKTFVEMTNGMEAKPQQTKAQVTQPATIPDKITIEGGGCHSTGSTWFLIALVLMIGMVKRDSKRA